MIFSFGEPYHDDEKRRKQERLLKHERDLPDDSVSDWAELRGPRPLNKSESSYRLYYQGGKPAVYTGKQDIEGVL